jgi:hypothetical protein
MSVY